MWDNRIWVHILYRIVTAFHVLHTGLGFKLELTKNEAWGEHCRKEALTHAALVNRHLSDGREWLLGGEAPTFADITLATAIAFSKFPVNATPLDERFEFLDLYWKRWQKRPVSRPPMLIAAAVYPNWTRRPSDRPVARAHYRRDRHCMAFSTSPCLAQPFYLTTVRFLN